MKEDKAQQFIFDEIKSLSKKIEDTKGLPDDLRDRLNQMLQRLQNMAELGHYASEYETVSKYIETVTSVPWSERTEDTLDLDKVKTVLDHNHYGMEYVKDRILEYMSTIILLKQRGRDAMAKAPILLFVGLQGVGKTTLAVSMAEALGRQYQRISLGAIGSPLELRGKSKAFPEAEPGQIVKALIKTKVRNPLILLDELEKASGEGGLRADIMAILLEILDPNQNSQFRDHFIDYPIDLSEVLFVGSANNTGTISAALMDRLEIIKMPSYSDQEKLVIARDYLLPKVMEKTGLNEGELQIEPTLWPAIVRPFGYDSGIRSLNRTLEAICRKVAKELVEGKLSSVTINESNLKYYLPK